MSQEREEYTIEDETAAKAGLFIIIPIIVLIACSFMFLWQENLIVVKQYYIDAKNTSNVFRMIYLMIIPFLVFLLSVIVHELLHALPIIIFARKLKGTFKFGFNGKAFVPYTFSKKSFKAYQYAIILILPAIFLGFIPLIYSFITGNTWIWLLGSTNIVACAGDFFSIYLLTKVKPTTLITDHDKKIGFIVSSPKS